MNVWVRVYSPKGESQHQRNTKFDQEKANWLI